MTIIKETTLADFEAWSRTKEEEEEEDEWY